MDARHFDALVQALSTTDSRRRLLAFLATLPIVGGLVGILSPEETEAKGRRKRRKKRHKHGRGRHRTHRKHKKKPCLPDSVAQTCAGACGSVTNNCQQAVDCGSCACTPPCAVCFTCQDQGANAPGTCVVDPIQQGQACGDPGQICQADGTCACDAASCPECTTCESGTCTACADCCDSSGVCQDGDTTAACGSSGTCDVCTGQEQCQNQTCVCVPACTDRNCGADGCSGSCGTCTPPQTCGGSGTAGVCGCTPNCTNKSCGPNGCGGTCGSCPSGQTCLSNGTCCTPATCQSLGKTCGIWPDGCDGTVSCGSCSTGPNTTCNTGTCATCPATCPASCDYCLNFADGSSQCAAQSNSACFRPCSSNADCPAQTPLCLSAFTFRANNETHPVSEVCPGRTTVCTIPTSCTTAARSASRAAPEGTVPLP